MLITLNHNWETKSLIVKKPHQRYTLKSGEIVPGVTTVLGLMNKPALLHWSASEERKGIIDCYNKQADIPEKFFYTIKRDTAADIGTAAHFMCECYLNNLNPSFEDLDDLTVEKGLLSFNKFKSHWDTSGLTVVQSEVQLVSEVMGYGGTSDCIAKDQDGNFILLDFKTGKAIYRKEHGMQMAAYKILWEHNNDTKIKACKLIRIGKTEPEDFEIWDCDDISPYQISFINLIILHHSLKNLPK